MERMGIEEGADATSKDLRAPMPGKVLEVLVQEGQSVEEGEAMLVLEAMKMENVLRAGAAGVVSMIGVEAGNAVEKEAVLISMEG
jgi:biotin carboxyl carrier protein